MDAPYTTRNDPIDIIPVEQQTGKLKKKGSKLLK